MPLGLTAAMLATLTGCGNSSDSSNSTGSSASAAVDSKLSADEVYQIVKQGYVYAYPAMLSDLSMRQGSNFAKPTGQVSQAPVNQFSHATAFTPPEFHAVVRPNVDTLYSIADYDLTEPIVLSVPAVDRYYLMQMSSIWTDVFDAPGSRTTGNAAHDFLLAGPGWNGTVPDGLELIKSPTRRGNIIGRTQTNGPEDYDAVHKIQAGYKLTPLSKWGKGDYTPPEGKVDSSVDMKTPPPVQIDKMDAVTFWNGFAALLEDNPPGPYDYPIMQQLRRAGFTPGKGFDLAKASNDIRDAYTRATTDGNALVHQLGAQASGKGQPGWIYSTTGGAFGVDYNARAAVANFALGENLPQDAVYPSGTTDATGAPLDGANNYVMHFDAGKLPPVQGFWSLTAYDADGYLIPNPINRYAIGDRNKFTPNPDGSVDLYLQATSPGPDKEANWLPVATGPFTLMMRLYWPQQSVIDRTWTPPAVTRA
ncbi:DUF1254 domain-containing protein [Nocardia sp. NPDC004582]